MALHWHVYHLLESGDVDDARRESRVLAPPRRGAAPADLPALRRALGDDVGDARRPRRRRRRQLILRTYEIGRRAQAPEIDIEAGGPAAVGRLAPRRARPVRRAARGAGARPARSSAPTCPVLALALRPGRRRSTRPRCSRARRIDFDAIPRDMLWLAACACSPRSARALGDARARRRALRPAARAPRPQRDGRHGQLHGLRRALPRPAGHDARRPPRRRGPLRRRDRAQRAGGLDARTSTMVRADYARDARGARRPGRRAARRAAARRDARRAPARRPRSPRRRPPSAPERAQPLATGCRLQTVCRSVCRSSSS